MFIGYIIFRELQFSKIQKDLLNRIMSKSYVEYVTSTTSDAKTVNLPTEEELYEEKLKSLKKKTLLN